MQPIQITLRPDGQSREFIEIATGDFLGHQAGTLSVDHVSGRTEYTVNRVRWFTYEAATHAMVAAAYSYVADQLQDTYRDQVEAA
jgi:hypothetical protein